MRQGVIVQLVLLQEQNKAKPDRGIRGIGREQSPIVTDPLLDFHHFTIRRQTEAAALLSDDITIFKRFNYPFVPGAGIERRLAGRERQLGVLRCPLPYRFVFRQRIKSDPVLLYGLGGAPEKCRPFLTSLYSKDPPPLF